MHKINLNGEIPMNCYIIENNNKCYIIDPGFEREVIIKYVNEHNLKVEGILLTHGHFDHIGAVDCFDVPVYLHESEVQIFNDNSNNGYIPHKLSRPYSLDNINLVPFSDNYVIDFDGKLITTISTPGHTAGGVCYLFEGNLYTGDTLFKGSIGKWTFPTGDLKILEKSLVNLFNTVTDDAIVVNPGHGSSSTIGDERLNNQFVKMAFSNKLYSNYYS